MYNRYYFRYHTIEQIVVGGIIGIGLGVLAFYLCRSIFLTNFVKKNKKDNKKVNETKEKNIEEKQSNIELDYKEENINDRNINVQQGTFIDNINNRKAMQQGEVERNMQRMSYDFHNEQVNDYINNYDNNGHYNSPQFTKINKISFNDDLSNNDNKRFNDNIAFNSQF